MPDECTNIIDTVPVARNQPQERGNEKGATDLIIVGLSRLKPHP
jgi:hypothetical protein